MHGCGVVNDAYKSPFGGKQWRRSADSSPTNHQRWSVPLGARPLRGTRTRGSIRCVFFSDHLLARRIEDAESGLTQAFAETVRKRGEKTFAVSIAGGAGVYAGPGSDTARRSTR
jgi:hypothetical protein